MPTARGGMARAMSSIPDISPSNSYTFNVKMLLAKSLKHTWMDLSLESPWLLTSKIISYTGLDMDMYELSIDFATNI